MVSSITQQNAVGYLRESFRDASRAAAPAPIAPEPYDFRVSSRDSSVQSILDDNAKSGGLAKPVNLASTPLDVDIVGRGYFHLKDGDDSYYTRSGSFTVGRDGRLVSLEGGFAVEPEIRVPRDAAGVSIDQNGVVRSSDGSGRQRTLGQIELTQFPQGAPLSEFGSSLIKNRNPNAVSTSGAPGSAGFGAISGASTRLSPLSNFSGDPTRAAMTRFASRVHFLE